MVYSREGRAWLWPGSQVRAIRLHVCIQEGERDTLTHAHVCAHTERDRDKERGERDRDRETDRNEKWDYVIRLQTLLSSHIYSPPRLYLRTPHYSPTVLPAGDQVFKHKNLVAAADVGGAHFMFEP